MGIDRSIFVGDVPEYLKCPMCLDVLEHPQQICSAQHLACNDCVINYFGTQSKKPCPVCRRATDFDSLLPSPFVERIIKDLKVNCSTSSCAWTGSYTDRLTHIGSLCPHRKVLCDDCFEWVVASARASHLVDSCPEQLISCSRGPRLCETFLRKNLDQHAKTCDQFKCRVKGSCSTRLTQRNRDTHENDCRRQSRKVTALQAEVDKLKGENTKLKQKGGKGKGKDLSFLEDLLMSDDDSNWL